MMKVTAIAALLIATGCSSLGERQVETECWKHTIDWKDWANNTLTMCSNGTYATRRIYYPNGNTPPTTCSQGGVVELSGDKMNFKFEIGECENQRQVAPAEVSCTKTQKDDLSCNIDDENGFLFVRQSPGV